LPADTDTVQLTDQHQFRDGELNDLLILLQNKRAHFLTKFFYFFIFDPLHYLAGMQAW
jgi:hypothetical protein